MLPQKFLFQCNSTGAKRKETWQGVVSYLRNYGSHYEMQIQSRSSILVIFGKTTRGYFACIPDWKAGCDLADFKDLFWNTEMLSHTIGMIDGITVANALYFLSKKVNLY